MNSNNGIKTVGDLIDAACRAPEFLFRERDAIWAAFMTAHEREKDEERRKRIAPVKFRDMTDPRKQALYKDLPEEWFSLPAVFPDLIGIDPALAEFADFIRTKVRKIPWIIGPTGVGKSTLITDVLRCLTGSKFYVLADCDYNEHPVHAMPHEERERQGFTVLGELCPKCAAYLQGELRGDWRNFPVKACQYGLGGQGAGMFRYEKKLPEPSRGVEPSDWYTVFKRANGGVLFINLGIQHEDFQRKLCNLLTDGYIHDAGLNEIWLDIAVISISNDEITGNAMVMVKDRSTVLRMGYVLSPDDDVEVQRKEERREGGASGHHFVPHVELAFANAVCASRQREGGNISIADRLQFHAGKTLLDETKTGWTTHTYRELMRKHEEDGKAGLGTRLVNESRRQMMRYGSCTGITQVVEVLRGVKTVEVSGPTGVFEKWRGEVKFGEWQTGEMEISYRHDLLRDLVMAYLGRDKFESHKESDFRRYCDHADAASHGVKVIEEGKYGKRDQVEPDVAFLKQVESHIGAAEGFRNRVGSEYFDRLRKKLPIRLSDIPPLEEAIVRRIVANNRMKVQEAVCLKPAKERKEGEAFDENEARKNLDVIKTVLLGEGFGYKECCVLKAIAYAEKHLFSA